ncbi:MAG: FKBP-type peptidyl-prolyl cis-trans isomerase [Bacteroidales bacterium]|nr:FKBP-type peptidyl-prolyl cis-trans isomerase [Bacteroidales bacterium]MBQ5540975.1 FKBP-type peptidyl-prolyl cis-trans isomerase [Bacteroidales bacterium]MBR4679361.1 FKBP-type peptidyl-prolyl cis-trans isomerase [Bacteroidales bacterium]
MKKIFILALIALTGNFAQAQKYFDKAKVSSSNDSLSYALGYMLSQNLVKEGITDFDATLIGKAFNDSKKNNSPLLSLDECKDVLQTFFQKKDDELKNSQLAKEKEFFAENAKKPGVKVTESGLQYKVVKEGSGKTPTDSSDVKIHYEGKLLDGTVFDSSYDSEEPTSLNMGFLIPGMVEGLKLMKEGAQYVFYIPQDLGYGEYSPGETLPAYSTLIFEIELISVDEPSEEQE